MYSTMVWAFEGKEKIDRRIIKAIRQINSFMANSELIGQTRCCVFDTGYWILDTRYLCFFSSYFIQHQVTSIQYRFNYTAIQLLGKKILKNEIAMRAKEHFYKLLLRWKGPRLARIPGN